MDHGLLETTFVLVGETQLFGMRFVLVPEVISQTRWIVEDGWSINLLLDPWMANLSLS